MSDLEDRDPIAPKSEASDATPQLPFPGVYDELAKLPPGTFVTEEGLATLLRKSTHTIQRALGRGELPAPAKMFGKPTWMAGAILRHHEKRMEQAEKDAEQLRRLKRAV